MTLSTTLSTTLPTKLSLLLQQIAKEIEETKENIEKKEIKITPAEYLADYKKKVKKFYELSVNIHEHNTFTPDNESTLTESGFYLIGNNLRLITSTFDEFSTLVEIGAGTGIGAHFMLAGLFGEKYPHSCVEISIREKEKKCKIIKYIYTDPFNELKDVPATYKKKYLYKRRKQILWELFRGIQQDTTITNTILLVVCPPPIHDDRNKRESISDQLVSTDVMALVESINCTKIKHVMIVRYNNNGREDLDGTVNFHSHHVPILQQFGKWFLHKPLIQVDSYFSCEAYYHRCLHWFSRNI